MTERATITIAEDLTTEEDVDALQVVYALTYSENRQAQMVLDFDENSALLALPSSDGTAFITHLSA